MAKQTSNQAFVNFLKVAGISLVQPTRIATGVITIGTSLVFPQFSIPLLLAGGAAVLSMSWADINNPDFINNILRQKTDDKNFRLSDLSSMIRELDRVSAAAEYEEVRVDLVSARDTLEKLNKLLSSMAASDRSQLDFVITQMSDIVTKMIGLAEKEQIARRYIQIENLDSLTKQQKDLRKSLQDLDDEVAKEQLNQALEQKELQIQNLKQVTARLKRIDAYITNARAALDNVYSTVTKLRLRDEAEIGHEVDILSATMKEVVADIDSFEQSSMGIRLTNEAEGKIGQTSDSVTV